MGERGDDEATARLRAGSAHERREPDTVPIVPEEAPRASPDDDLATSQLPARFEPISLLGRGGMGRVLRVQDRSLNREVAVKLVRAHADERARLRFLREARAAGTLHHPNIVTVHDIAPEGEYLVMELVEGESLANRLSASTSCRSTRSAGSGSRFSMRSVPRIAEGSSTATSSPRTS